MLPIFSIVCTAALAALLLIVLELIFNRMYMDAPTFLAISRTIRTCLEYTSKISPGLVADLLRQDEMCTESDVELGEYPRRPYYRELARCLIAWDQASMPPVFSPGLKLLDTVSDEKQRIHLCTPKVKELFNNWTRMTEYDRIQALESIINYLDFPGVQAMFGMHRTFKSLPQLPPSYSTLMKSAIAMHTPKFSLTVAGRALSKHSHRAGDKWWPEVKGKTDVINERALSTLKKILREAVWMNAHMLPHDTPVFEVRQGKGYGARWSADGTFFRGFLEPQMEGGHEKGWRHDFTGPSASEEVVQP